MLVGQGMGVEAMQANRPPNLATICEHLGSHTRPRAQHVSPYVFIPWEVSSGRLIAKTQPALKHTLWCEMTCVRMGVVAKQDPTPPSLNTTHHTCEIKIW